MTWYFSHP